MVLHHSPITSLAVFASFFLVLSLPLPPRSWVVLCGPCNEACSAVLHFADFSSPPSFSFSCSRTLSAPLCGSTSIPMRDILGKVGGGACMCVCVEKCLCPRMSTNILAMWLSCVLEEGPEAGEFFRLRGVSVPVRGAAWIGSPGD